MDVVYVCRPGENEELRYSLRSVEENLPYRKLWVIGNWPAWLKNVDRVRTQPVGDRYARAYGNLMTALETYAISERFVLMMDDVFVMKPGWVLAPLHRGEISDGPGSQHYGMIVKTGAWLREHGYSAINYETHAPFVFEKSKLREIVELDAPRAIARPTVRTLYGNIHRIGGWPTEDFKVRPPYEDLDRPFLSTSDAGFARAVIGEHIRARFPQPSPYEGDA